MSENALYDALLKEEENVKFLHSDKNFSFGQTFGDNYPTLST